MSDLAATALVTGGSRGIGKTVAETLGRDGFHVLLTYVSKPVEAQAVVDGIIAKGGSARAVKLDVSDSDSVAEFFRTEIKDRVRLDVLVNNAGITADGFLIRMRDEDFDRVIAANLRGAFLCMREAAKIMTRQRQGRIVNMTSVVGLMGNASQVNYAASKAGVIGMTKSAAKELGSRNITVNAVAPGFIETDMTAALPEEVRAQYLKSIPLGRLGSVEDVAEAVSFLASPRAAYITGQVLSVNGGMYT